MADAHWLLLFLICSLSSNYFPSPKRDHVGYVGSSVVTLLWGTVRDSRRPRSLILSTPTLLCRLAPSPTPGSQGLCPGAILVPKVPVAHLVLAICAALLLLALPMECVGTNPLAFIFFTQKSEVPGCESLEPEGGGDWTVSFPTILCPPPESLNEN